MPNHVTNTIEIADADAYDLAEIRRAFVNEKGHVDFELISPTPECLKDFEPHHGILSSAKAALGLLKVPSPALDQNDFGALTERLEFSNTIKNITTETKKEDVPLIIRAMQNYTACGYMYWYDWNNENWGTKWNAYGQPMECLWPA